MRDLFEDKARVYPFTMECLDGPVMENWLAEQQDIRQEFFGTPLARHNWESLHDVCFKRSTVRLKALRENKKYISELYIDRAIQTEFGKFLNGRKTCFVVVGKAGAGKTNLLCRFTEEHLSNVPCLLLLGSSIILNSERALAQRILSELLFDETVNVEVAGENLASMLAGRRQHMLVLIDAINENSSVDRIRASLKYLTEFVRDKRIKLCISCRDIFWDFFKDCFIESDVYSPTGRKDMPVFIITKETPDKPVSGLGDFADAEYERALERYFDYFSISGSVTAEAKERCRHPLLLRFFCEAYEGQDIGIKEDIRLLELFDLYWERKLENLRITMGLRTAQNLRAFLLTLSRLMREGRTNALPVSAVVEQTRTDVDSAQSIYTRILDENIILEEEVEKPRGVRMVRFVYDEFFEYVIARGIWEQYEASPNNNRMLQKEVFDLAADSDSFPNFAGAVQYLLLMVEKGDKDLFLELVRGLACRCFPGLHISTIPVLLDRIEALGPRVADALHEWMVNLLRSTPEFSWQPQSWASRLEERKLLWLADIFPDIRVAMHVLVENLVIRDGHSIARLASAVESLARHKNYIVKRIAMNKVLWIAATKPSVASKVLKHLAKSESKPVRKFANNTERAMRESLLICQPANRRKHCGWATRVFRAFAKELARTSQQNYIIWYLEHLSALRHRIGRELNLDNTLTYLLETSRVVFLLRESVGATLGGLTDRERQIIECRFGLGLPGSLTINETAMFLHLSPTTIWRGEAKALRKMRHPQYSRKLRDYIGRRVTRVPEYALLACIFGFDYTRFEFEL